MRVTCSGDDQLTGCREIDDLKSRQLTAVASDFGLGIDDYTPYNGDYGVGDGRMRTRWA